MPSIWLGGRTWHLQIHLKQSHQASTNPPDLHRKGQQLIHQQGLKKREKREGVGFVSGCFNRLRAGLSCWECLLFHRTQGSIQGPRLPHPAPTTQAQWIQRPLLGSKVIACTFQMHAVKTTTRKITKYCFNGARGKCHEAMLMEFVEGSCPSNIRWL